jgi:hypothetical protein
MVFKWLKVLICIRLKQFDEVLHCLCTVLHNKDFFFYRFIEIYIKCYATALHLIQQNKFSIMFKEKRILFIALLSIVSISACSQKEEIESVDKTASVPTKAEVAKELDPHPYGGWYCPDNLNGFPPMDVVNLDQLVVVKDRLPTKEETQNGVSLMYIDPEVYPDAKALDIQLPRLARYHSNYSGKDELVILIQAVLVQTDTVVGFRYLNGGNGTSWFSEVDLLSDEEVNEVGSTPFVYTEIDINAPKEKVWKIISRTNYMHELAKMFNVELLINSDWEERSPILLKYDKDGIKAKGSISSLWGMIYIQIDYDYNGREYTEKILVYDDEETKLAHMQIVSGPHKENITEQEKLWTNWKVGVKSLSEKD